MAFEKVVPTWNAAGSEPPETLKNTGFQAGYKPPAEYFNWFWNGVSKCIDELQEQAWDKFAGMVSENTDMDDYTDVGIYTYSYSAASTVANIPEKSQGTLLVLPRMVNENASNLMQVVLTQNNSIYFRNKVDGAWNDWTTLRNSKDVVPISNGGTGATTAEAALSALGAVSKTGDTMSGNLTIQNGSWPALRLKAPGDSNVGYLEGSYSTAGTVALWNQNDSEDNSIRRGLKIYNSGKKTNASDAIEFVDYIGTEVPKVYRLFGEHNIVPIAYGGTGKTSANEALAALKGISREATMLEENGNLDECAAVGLYTYAMSTASTIVNAPEKSQTTVFVLPRMNNSAYGNRIQIAFTSNNNIYVRNLQDNVWNNWRKFFKNDDVIPVSNGGTGVNSHEDKVYTSLRYRASSLHNTETAPTVNGAICWQYK